jgi:hypothetical protein
MDERKLSKFTKADCNLGSGEQRLLSLTGSKIGCQAKREKLVVSVVGLGGWDWAICAWRVLAFSVSWIINQLPAYGFERSRLRLMQAEWLQKRHGLAIWLLWDSVKKKGESSGWSISFLFIGEWVRIIWCMGFRLLIKSKYRKCFVVLFSEKTR